MSGIDQYAKLVIHAEGVNDGTTFTDSSLTGHSITAVGVANTSSDQKKFGNTSLELAGSGYISVPHSDEFNFGTTDWTIDFWVYNSSDCSRTVMSKKTGSRGWELNIGVSSGGSCLCQFSGFDNNQVEALTFYAWIPASTSSWYHLALMRNGTQYKIYYNGLYYTTTVSVNTGVSIDTTYSLKIGYGLYEYNFNGFIDEVRFSVGIARWTSMFTAPTAEFSNDTGTSLLFHFNGTNYSTTFTEATGKSVTRSGDIRLTTSYKKFGTASANFDGTNDYLILSDSADFDFGSGDFDIAVWLYPTILTGTWRGIVVHRTEYNDDYAFGLWQNTDYLTFEYTLDGTTISSVDFTAKKLTINSWNFVAISRKGSRLYCNINGVVQVATISSSAFYNSSENLLIGFAYNRTYYYKGYMDDLKILKGSTVFADEFTPYTVAYTQVISIFIPDIVCTKSLEISISVSDLPEYALEAATSATDPFLITYSGTLSESSSGPIWKLFNHTPTQYESSQDVWGDGETVQNTDSTSDPFRAVLINLGVGNEKCFNKFRHCASKNLNEYYAITSLHIQATNELCSVIDPISDSKWVNLFNNTVSYNNVHGSWQSSITIPNEVSYRYYRIIPSDGYGTWAATEFLFYERIVAENDVSIYIPEIITTEELTLITRIVISEITIPEITLQQILEMELYAQVLGVDDHTVLMLHMDGENSSQNFVDSSYYEQEITIVGSDGYPVIWETGGDPDSFLGCGLFDGILNDHFQYLTFENIEDYDLGLNNTPFCIDFRMYVSFTYATDPIIFMRGDDLYGVFYRVQLFRADQRIRFDFKTSSGMAYVEYAGISWSAWHHIAITYDGTTTRLFVDGVSRGTPVTNNYVKPSTCTLTYLGNNTYPSLDRMFIGRLDEFRISNGVPRWTHDFLVPVDPYEWFDLNRTIQIPNALLTHSVSLANIFIAPAPIPIPEILITKSLLISSIFMGFKLSIPTIMLTASGEFSLQITIDFSAQLTHSFTTRVFCNAPPLLTIPEIALNQEMTVVDVFLGSKVQVPDIVTTESVQIQYSSGWYNVDYGVTKKSGITLVSDDLGEVLFSVENTYEPKFAISVNSGRNWEQVFPLTLPENSTPEIRISGNGQVLMVCALIYTPTLDMNLVQISLDQGQSWSKIDHQIFYNTPMSVSNYPQFELNYDGTVIYFGQRNIMDYTENYIFKSFDYGETWREITPGNGSSYLQIKINKDGDKILVVATHENTIYYSEDYGETWSDFTIDEQYNLFGTENFINSTGSIILTNGREKVAPYLYHYFVSTDKGNSWSVIDAPASLLFDHNEWDSRKWTLSISDNGQIGLAAIEEKNCYLSVDACQSWTLIYPTGLGTEQWDLYTFIVSKDGYRLFVSKDYGQVYSSNVDQVDQWRLINFFREKLSSSLLFKSNGNCDDLVVGDVGYSIYQSTLQGKMWWPIFGTDYDRGWTGIGISEDGSKILLSVNAAYIGGVLFYSSDYGENWMSWNPLMHVNVPGVGAANSEGFFMCGMSGDGNVLIAGLINKDTYAPKLYRSINSGSTWAQQTVLNSNADWWDCSLNYDGSVILIGDGDFLVRLYSNSWSKIYPGGITSSRNWCCAVNSTGDIMLAGNNAPGRLYKSVDYGANWTEIRPDGNQDKYWTTCSMSADGSVMLAGTYKYLATEDGQLFKSEDYGVSWTEQKMITRIEDIYYGFTDSAVSSDGSVLYAGDIGLWTNRPITNEPVTLQKSIPDITTIQSALLDQINLFIGELIGHEFSINFRNGLEIDFLINFLNGLNVDIDHQIQFKNALTSSVSKEINLQNGLLSYNELNKTITLVNKGLSNIINSEYSGFYFSERHGL